MDFYYSAVVDGGCYDNGAPNALGYGSFKMYKMGNLIIHDQFYLCNAHTNNQAEWLSLLRLLECITDSNKFKEQDWLIQCDSELVRNQFLGLWNCKDVELNKILLQCRELANKIKSVELQHIDNKDVKRILGH